MGFVTLCIALLALAKSWGHLQAFGSEPSKCVLGHGPLEARAWQRLKNSGTLYQMCINQFRLNPSSSSQDAMPPNRSLHAYKRVQSGSLRGKRDLGHAHTRRSMISLYMHVWSERSRNLSSALQLGRGHILPSNSGQPLPHCWVSLATVDLERASKIFLVLDSRSSSFWLAIMIRNSLLVTINHSRGFLKTQRWSSFG
ncbi:hypothetical protein VNO77_23103 [Canavalia gladiata]|uniref:Uncharacterized protein n=1 Tax=Canavalia gladiata TaxID=3824 RepID=A0AAN9L768_CANGL